MTAALNFWSTAFWIIGGASFTYYLQLFIALQQYIEKDYSFAAIPLGKWFNCEAATFTATVLWLPLALLHAAAWYYAKAAEKADKPAPRFPDSVFSVVTPADKPWLRVVLFVLLLVAPSAGYVFTVGRIFDHYGIVYIDVVRNAGQDSLLKTATAQNKAIATLSESERRNAVIPAEIDAAGKNALRGWKLLTSRPEAGGRQLDWNSSGWNWLNMTQLEKETRPFPEDTTLKIPHLVKTQALPIFQPWGYILMALTISISTITLILRGWRRRTTMEGNALANS